MTALTERFDDITEPLGIGVGALLVLMGLGTVAGAPWATNGSLGVSALQLIGVVAMMLVGAGLAYVSWTGRE
jgi:hypothetical protein